jgi:hypothetical protein
MTGVPLFYRHRNTTSTLEILSQPHRHSKSPPVLGQRRGAVWLVDHARNVAPNLSFSRRTILSRILLASLSVSVRSSAWKVRL